MTGTADRSPTQPTPAAGTSAREVLRSGTDPDEALEFYRGVYDGRDMAFAPSSSPFGFRYRATGDGRLSLRTSSVSAARSGVLAPERQYLLAWSVEGGIVVDDDVLLRAGVPVMYPAGRPFHVSTPAGTTHLVHFDADFLETVAVVGTGTAPVPLVLPVTASATRLAPLQAVLRAVARPLLDVAVVGAERTALDLRLAEAVLEAFRSDDGRRRSAAPAGAVERAKAFMSAHFDRTIAATDIAAAAEVSVRTLQEGFQRREGSTPMAYLRDLRLEQARLGLRLADARETSVAAVAHSCGFRHMGRFSGSYYAMYGEYPGDTLRGRRRLIAAADIVG